MSDDFSARLALPYLAAGQMQKHVTLNEALTRLDALLTWVPVVGTAYTVGTGGWLMLQAVRAKASPKTLAQMAAYMAIDTATGTVPIAGDVVDTFFPGQLLAAKALQKDIEATHWVADAEANAKASGDHERHLETVRTSPTLRRIVYLHD